MGLLMTALVFFLSNKLLYLSIVGKVGSMSLCLFATELMAY